MGINFSVQSPSFQTRTVPAPLTRNPNRTEHLTQVKDTVHLNRAIRFGNQHWILAGGDNDGNQMVSIDNTLYSIVPTGINVTGIPGQSAVTQQIINYLYQPNTQEMVGYIYSGAHHPTNYTSYKLLSDGQVINITPGLYAN